mgnify:CR=1 FL=1
MSPRALRLACIQKGRRWHCPEEVLPSVILGDAAALILVARQQLGVLGDGGSAQGSTVQLRVLLAARGPLLWLSFLLPPAGGAVGSWAAAAGTCPRHQTPPLSPSASWWPWPAAGCPSGHWPLCVAGRCHTSLGRPPPLAPSGGSGPSRSGAG